MGFHRDLRPLHLWAPIGPDIDVVFVSKSLPLSGQTWAPVFNRLAGDYIRLGSAATEFRELNLQLPTNIIGEIRSIDDDGDFDVRFPNLLRVGSAAGVTTYITSTTSIQLIGFTPDFQVLCETGGPGAGLCRLSAGNNLRNRSETVVF